MKRYIALIAIVLLSMPVAFASASACSISAQDTAVHDTVIVYDTVYNYIHDTVYTHDAGAEDTMYVYDTVQVTYEFRSVSVVSSALAYGKAAGSGSFPNGTTIELGAVPAKGCRFVRWQDGNTDNPRQVVVNGNMFYTAYFDTVAADQQGKGRRPFAADRKDEIVHDTIYDTVVIDRRDTIYIPALFVHDTVWVDTNQFFDVIILSGNEEKGLVSGNGQFMKGTEVEIAAIPAEGHRFVFWHDGDKTNPRRLTVDEIQIFVAEFAPDTAVGGSEEPEDPQENPFEPQVEMLCDGLTLSIACPGHAIVRIFTLDGRLVSQSDGTGDKRDNTVRPFQLPQAGVYLVQVANFPVRKIALQEGYQHKL